MANILETIVRQNPDVPDQKIVEFIGNDGNQVSVLLEGPQRLDHNELIARTKRLLTKSSQPETAAQSHTAAIAEQPAGPVPAANPLLEDYDPDGDVVSVVVTLNDPEGHDGNVLVSRAKAFLMQVAEPRQGDQGIESGRRAVGRAEDAETLNEQLDEGLEQSFPGSDPVWVTSTAIPDQPEPE
ncbi:hypothetical protein [Phyllobacterium sp. SB3]|uniref:hypothetical protein n=1 Tax=Phyllobacterium sp. SB3 TaxID=3156073 RepID=UPI0032AF7E4F